MTEKPTLKEVLGYTIPDYYTDEEKKFIKNTFAKPEALKLLRKMFIPIFADPELPIEQMGKDFFLAGREWANIPADEAKILMVARQEVAKFNLGTLLEIKQIAMQPEETAQEKAARMAKDSNK